MPSIPAGTDSGRHTACACYIKRLAVNGCGKWKVVTNCDHLARLKFSRILPHAFTEHGAIMAASPTQNHDDKTSPCRATPTATRAADRNGAASSRRGAPGRSHSASRGGKRIAGGRACVKFATKRRSRRTGDPETAHVGRHRSGLQRCKADRAAICVAAGWTGRQFASLESRQGGNLRRAEGAISPPAGAKRGVYCFTRKTVALALLIIRK